VLRETLQVLAEIREAAPRVKAKTRTSAAKPSKPSVRRRR
jgi:hypothetical protein